MPELNDNDFRNLFRAAGHDEPERDLSDRIMARVAVARVAQPTVVQPLISKRGWAAIAGTAMVILVAAVIASGSSTAAPALPYVGNLVERFSQIRMPVGQWPQWVIGGSLLALFFAVIMRKAEHREVA